MHILNRLRIGGTLRRAGTSLRSCCSAGGVCGALRTRSVDATRALCSVKRYKRIGPFICACVGALCYLLGFGGLYAAATGHIAAPFPLLCALAYIASNGGTWLEAAAVATCVRNFETERGSVVGILKAFLGLSASLYTTLYMTLCAQPLQFLKLLAVVPTGVALVASLGVNAVPFRQVWPHHARQPPGGVRRSQGRG